MIYNFWMILIEPMIYTPVHDFNVTGDLYATHNFKEFSDLYQKNDFNLCFDL